MKTISKGRYGVTQQLTKDGIVMCCGFVARGSKKQCYEYIIKLAKDARLTDWDEEVQLSLHVFPKSTSAFFHILKYKGNYEVDSRIEYQIERYEDNEKKETKQK